MSLCLFSLVYYLVIFSLIAKCMPLMKTFLKRHKKMKKETSQRMFSKNKSLSHDGLLLE